MCLGEEPVQPALDGNGKDLVFETGTVNEATAFEVPVTRIEEPGAWRHLPEVPPP